MPVATVNDIELNYKLEGEGEETIVLVNGLADDLETWVLQVDDFLAEGYRVLRATCARGRPARSIRCPGSRSRWSPPGSSTPWSSRDCARGRSSWHPRCSKAATARTPPPTASPSPASLPAPRPPHRPR